MERRKYCFLLLLTLTLGCQQTTGRVEPIGDRKTGVQPRGDRTFQFRDLKLKLTALQVFMPPNGRFGKVSTRTSSNLYREQADVVVPVLVSRYRIRIELYRVGPELKQIQNQRWHRYYLERVEHFENLDGGALIQGTTRYFKETELVVWRNYGAMTIACRAVLPKRSNEVNHQRATVLKVCRNVRGTGPKLVDKVQEGELTSYKSERYHVRFRHPRGVFLDETDRHVLTIYFPRGSAVHITAGVRKPGCFKNQSPLSPESYALKLERICKSLRQLPRSDPVVVKKPPSYQKHKLNRTMSRTVRDIVKRLTATKMSQRKEGQARLRDLLPVAARTTDQILALIQAPDAIIAAAAVRYWAEMKKTDPRYLPVLTSGLTHKSDRVRYTALISIRFLTTAKQLAQTLPYVRFLLGDKSGIVRAEALAVLVDQGGLAYRVDVKSALSDPAHQVKGLAAELAARLGIVDVSKPLRKLLDDPAGYVRCKALKSLATLHEKVSVDPRGLEKLLEDRASATYTTFFDDGGAITYSIDGTVSECAMREFPKITEQKFKGDPEVVLGKWMNWFAGRQGKKPSKNKYCNLSKHCADGQICRKIVCVPFEKAESTFWKVEEQLFCLKKKKLSGVQAQLAIAAIHDRFGIGSAEDSRAYAQLRKFALKKTESWQKMQEQIKQSTCR